MSLIPFPKASRGQWIMAGVHVGMLAVALAAAWEYDGPNSYKAGWAIILYFLEIGVLSTAEFIVGLIQRSSSAT